MTAETEAMELWREDWHQLALLVNDYEDVRMNEAVSRLYSRVDTKLAELRARERAILQALHDAINRPKGIVPESAEPFYNPRQALEADHGA